MDQQVVNSATLASKADLRRMQYWQVVWAEKLIYFHQSDGLRIL
jgi:hypothetical protein